MARLQETPLFWMPGGRHTIGVSRHWLRTTASSLRHVAPIWITLKPGLLVSPRLRGPVCGWRGGT